MSGNNLRLAYNLALSSLAFRTDLVGSIEEGSCLIGSNLLSGYIYLSGAAASALKSIAAGLTPSVRVICPAAVRPARSPITVAGQLVKLGSQRLINNDPGTYTGGVDIREGVLRIAKWPYGVRNLPPSPSIAEPRLKWR